MVVCLEILACAAGSSKVDTFIAHASESLGLEKRALVVGLRKIKGQIEA
jgi:hypothetical protein